MPDTNDAYDIGSALLSWKDLFLSGDADVTGTGTFGGLLPETHDSFDLGITGTRWENVWLSGNADIDGSVGVGTAAPGITTLLSIAGLSSSGGQSGFSSKIEHNSALPSAEGGGFICTLLTAASFANPEVYGGIFSAAVDTYVNPTGDAKIIGGWFRTTDAVGMTYDFTGVGTYEFRASQFEVADGAGDWTTNDPPVTTSCIYIFAAPTGYGTNHTHYAIQSLGGDVELTDGNVATTGTLGCGTITVIANSDINLSGTGQIFLADGANGDPALSFTSDPDMGFVWNGAGGLILYARLGTPMMQWAETFVSFAEQEYLIAHEGGVIKWKEFTGGYNTFAEITNKNIDFLDTALTTTGTVIGGGAKVQMTPIGGVAIKLTNTTGAVTVAGQLVKADTTTDDAVILTGADDLEGIGVFLDSGVADDAEAWVVISGIADVAMQDNTTATRGNWVRVSITEVGYADATNLTVPQPINQTHFAEIGHCIETVTATGGGTHVLARCVLHFN